MRIAPRHTTLRNVPRDRLIQCEPHRRTGRDSATRCRKGVRREQARVAEAEGGAAVPAGLFPGAFVRPPARLSRRPHACSRDRTLRATARWSAVHPPASAWPARHSAWCPTRHGIPSSFGHGNANWRRSLLCRACVVGPAPPFPASSPGAPTHAVIGLTPCPHLRRDWGSPLPRAPGPGLTPAASAPGLGSPLPHLR